MTASRGRCCSPTFTCPAPSLRGGPSSCAPHALPLPQPLRSGPCPAPHLPPKHSLRTEQAPSSRVATWSTPPRLHPAGLFPQGVSAFLGPTPPLLRVPPLRGNLPAPPSRPPGPPHLAPHAHGLGFPGLLCGSPFWDALPEASLSPPSARPPPLCCPLSLLPPTPRVGLPLIRVTPPLPPVSLSTRSAFFRRASHLLLSMVVASSMPPRAGIFLKS